MKTKIIVQLFLIYFLCNSSFSQITFIASSTAYSNTTTLTINKPASTGQNDVMLAHIAVEDDNGTVDVTPPAGWTLIRTLNNYPYLITYTYYKVAGAAEPGSYAFTRSTASYDMYGAISTYNGVDTSTPIEAENGQNTAASSSHATPSINSTSANAMIVCFYAVDYNNGCQTWTAPGGMTERYDGCGSATYQSISSADVIQVSAGATGAKTATSSASGTKGTAQIVALKPAPLIPMSYSSCTATQGNTSKVYKNTIHNQVIGIQVVTTGSSSPLSVTTFTFNTTGCSNAAADISNAKVFYSGTSSTFTASAQFGSTVASPNGTFTFTGTQTLSSGTNYFWLTYDIRLGATVSNVIDAQCTGLTVTTVRTPTVTNPAGSRQIKVISGQFVVSAGTIHSSAICINGTGSGWGDNAGGQMGDGTNTDRHTPVSVSSLTGLVSIAGGGLHTLALKNDGTLWAWGRGVEGQLGDGNFVSSNVPVQVSGLTGVTAMCAGGYHSMALKSDGTLWVWGNNASGEIGDGTGLNKGTPVQVLTGVVAIDAEFLHSLAAKNDGTVWAWGYNGDGQLGDGTTATRYAPVQVSGLTGAIAVASGGAQSYAMKNDGTLWAWGDNQYGQLGNGTTTDSNTPVQSSITNVIAIAGGNNHALAIKNDTTLWTWGSNVNGQLGDGTTTQRNSPIQVSGLTLIIAVSGGGAHSAALKNDGTVWTWGYNTNGQLGDGTTTQRISPVQVSSLCLVSPLPIELLDFNALAISGEEKVKLTWATASETNNDFFTLQRSRDAVNWENMKEVDGAGNSTNTISYVDYDSSPYPGTSYYRLKQTDYDGQYSHSDIRAVSFEGIEIIRTYPVPADNFLNLTINTHVDTDVIIELYNSLGQSVLQEYKYLNKGANNYTMNTELFAEGNYLIKVQTADLLYSDKVLFIIK